MSSVHIVTAVPYDIRPVVVSPACGDSRLYHGVQQLPPRPRIKHFAHGVDGVFVRSSAAAPPPRPPLNISPTPTPPVPVVPSHHVPPCELPSHSPFPTHTRATHCVSPTLLPTTTTTRRLGSRVPLRRVPVRDPWAVVGLYTPPDGSPPQTPPRTAVCADAGFQCCASLCICPVPCPNPVWDATLAPNIGAHVCRVTLATAYHQGWHRGWPGCCLVIDSRSGAVVVCPKCGMAMRPMGAPWCDIPLAHTSHPRAARCPHTLS